MTLLSSHQGWLALGIKQKWTALLLQKLRAVYFFLLYDNKFTTKLAKFTININAS